MGADNWEDEGESWNCAGVKWFGPTARAYWSTRIDPPRPSIARIAVMTSLARAASLRTVGGVPEDLLVHLRRARDLIDREFASAGSDLGSAALAAGIPKFHFVRLFDSLYGQTPGQYRATRRIERAQHLLRTANLSVTEVSHAVGFQSLGTFSRRFRAMTGESPSHFQHHHSSNECGRVPGCVVLIWGLTSEATSTAIEEKHDVQARP